MAFYNREKLFDLFDGSPRDPSISENTIALLAGNKESTQDDTDNDLTFRQESNFHYLFGVNEPDFYGILDFSDRKSILFVPDRDDNYPIWHGYVYPLSHYLEYYSVSEVKYVSELSTWIQKRKPDQILTIGTPNPNTNQVLTEPTFDGIDKFRHLIRRDTLHHKISDCRVIKTKLEIEHLKKLNDISSQAHIEIMRNCRIGMKEYQLQSVFTHYCLFNHGLPNLAYQAIVGSGINSAILHYQNNDSDIESGDLVLVDMGAESNCYASDITRTFPANGKFTEKQRDIYLIVLSAQNKVIESMKPGVYWSDMHNLSLQIIVDGLRHLGIIVGDPGLISEKYLELGACFMPHGIGHFMGKDTHDVGGSGSVAYCRQKKTILQEGMVLTVEPGIYFIKSLLERTESEPISQFLNYKKISEYLDFGGIRIEDNIVITKDGNFNLTTVPKDIESIEKIMNTLPGE